jgi:hypothetical protein
VAFTIFGATAITFMMVMYALESRGRQFIAVFALGCALSSVYRFLAGTWPFGFVESVWMLVALRRYHSVRPGTDSGSLDAGSELGGEKPQ